MRLRSVGTGIDAVYKIVYDDFRVDAINLLVVRRANSRPDVFRSYIRALQLSLVFTARLAPNRIQNRGIFSGPRGRHRLPRPRR